MHRIFFIVVMLFSFSWVWANECSVWEGKVIKPINPADLALRIVKIPRYKKEYETTAAFNARVDKALLKIKKQYIATVFPDMDYVVYDADDRKLLVSGLVLGSRVDFTGFSNPDYYLSGGEPFYIRGMYYERKVGSYTGVNGFGMKTRVDKYDGAGVVILDKIVKYDSLPIDGFIIENLNPSQAKSLKSNFNVAIELYPKKPYFDFISRHYGATIDDPEEVDINYTVVFADMKCALFHDNKGKVFKGVPITLPTSPKPIEKPIVSYISEVKKSLEPFEYTLKNGKCRKIKIELTFKPIRSDVVFDTYLPDVRNKAIEIVADAGEDWLNEVVKKRISVATDEIIKDAQVVNVFLRGGFCDSQLRY